MLESLKSRPITTLPDAITFEGRILYLTVDPALVRSQLQGQDLSWTPDIPLRDDISTDEITPAYICYYYDETLGEFPYLGLKCRDEFPITRGAVKRGGFVAGYLGCRQQLVQPGGGDAGSGIAFGRVNWLRRMRRSVK